MIVMLSPRRLSLMRTDERCPDTIGIGVSQVATPNLIQLYQLNKT